MSRAVTTLQLPAKEKILAFIDAVRIKLGVQLILLHTLRTWPEQAYLYAKGRTLPGPIVTNAKPGDSWHNYGLAADFGILTLDKKIIWAGPWDTIGALGEEMGLVWGGRFKKLADECHFEYHYVLRDGVETKVTLAELKKEHEEYLARTGGEKEIQWHS